MDIHTTQIEDRDRLEARTGLSSHFFVNRDGKRPMEQIKKIPAILIQNYKTFVIGLNVY